MARAVVYNSRMRVRGGGERSTLAFARALQLLGYDVEVLSCRPIPTLPDLVEFFGVEFAVVPVRQVRSEDIFEYLRDSELDVFVNHSHGELPQNPGKVGLCVRMAPPAQNPEGGGAAARGVLRSYHLLVSNSRFTKEACDRQLEFPFERSVVLYPPIGSACVARGREFLVNLPEKQRQILSVGRFSDSPNAHNKNQRIIAEAFLAALSEAAEVKDWRLVLAGASYGDKYSRRALEAVRQLAAASSGRIEVHSNLPWEQLSNLMAASALYVHGAGAFHTLADSAVQCEHFGLSIVEAMAHGCVPLVYNRGGILELFAADWAEYTYDSFDVLVEKIGLVISAEGRHSAEGERRQRLIQKAIEFDHNRFTEQLEALIKRARGRGA